MKDPAKELLYHIEEGFKKRHAHFEKLREGNKLHATNLIDFCPREYALCLHHKLMFNAGRPTSLAQKVTYEIGRRIEAMVIEALVVEKVVVNIENIACSCASPYPILFTPDIFVQFNVKDIPYIVEVKSIKPEAFDVLETAQVTHECQLSLYLWFASLLKMKVHTEDGLILYVVKTQKPMPMKCFHIRRNEDFIKRVQTQLDELKTFSKKKVLPKRICNSPLALMAKCCQKGVVELCFKDIEDEK